ncbi:MAG: aminomethyltransferase family protein [candidate division Zixibacteria bacterium]|nr:aminomethyltransferase family protein [candidate division Zixibacteria bacterium]
MSPLLLNDHHKAHGAVFEEIANWSAPLRYGDMADEHRAVRAATGLIDLSYRGKVRMTGKDRQAFLHRMVTNDINTLNPGESVYACLLTPQGKIIVDMTVYLREEDILLDTEPGMAATLQTALDRYALIDDVKIEEVTTDYGLIGLHGPSATSLLRDIFLGITPPETAKHTDAEWDGTRIVVAHAPRTGETGYDLYVPAERTLGLWTSFLETGKPYGLRVFGYETLETLRVEAGIPRYGAELDDRILPNEAVREKAISFNKGCYIGQEPVVMMEHRGRPNRLLAGLRINGDARPPYNAPILSGDQEAGWITSAVQGRSVPAILALGFIRRKYFAPGATFAVKTSTGLVEAELAELPFYRKES